MFFASIAFLGLAATMWRFAYAVSDGPDAPPPSPRGCVSWLVKGRALQPLASAPAVARILGERRDAGRTASA